MNKHSRPILDHPLFKTIGPLHMALLWPLLMWISPVNAEAGQFSTIEPIELKVPEQLFVPKGFYIKGILDERTDRSPVAFLVPAASSGNQLQTVDLKGGTLEALENFMTKSLPQNKSLRPIVVKIKDCKIMETLVDSQRGIVEGQVHLDFGFELEREDDLVHLLDFQGGMSYKRGVRQHVVIEPVFRRSLGNALNYFNNWMEKEVPINEKLAKGVKVTIRDYRDNLDNDTVFYNPERPLTWADFKGRPRFGNYAASIFASISYEGNSKVIDGMVHLDLVLKTYMLKSSSWVRSNNHHSYGLNHEQRHFDIAKIITERLREKISSLELQPHNFDRVISHHYLEAYREMNRLQEQYDKETSHGMNKSAQERWNKKIDEELSAFDVIENG